VGLRKFLNFGTSQVADIVTHTEVRNDFLRGLDPQIAAEKLKNPNVNFKLVWHFGEAIHHALRAL